MENISPYKKSKNLLTKTEADFYVYLKAAVNNDFHINKMTRMCDLVDVDKSLSSKQYMSYFRSISQYHIDFTLCDPFSFKPVICIELDDPSHERADRIKRDEKVNKIFADINFPLLRIKTERKYNVEKLRNLIDSNLNNAKGKSSKLENHLSEDLEKIDIKIDQEGMAQKIVIPIIKPKIPGLVAPGIIVIIALILIPVAFKTLATKLISRPKTNIIKLDAPKPVPNVPRGFDNSRTKSNSTSKVKTQPSVAPANNSYNLKDITISTSSRNQLSNQGNQTNKNEVKIQPNHYAGNFTVEMVWEGNYKSGNGVIALLDCGTQWLLIEQLASGLQLEHKVKKLTKETHTELLPVTKSSSNYYMITSFGTLQEWNNSGKVNEFKRIT
jgi:very-short-patch-repair endonuclease